MGPDASEKRRPSVCGLLTAAGGFERYIEGVLKAVRAECNPIPK
jgi:hypothetical protein